MRRRLRFGTVGNIGRRREVGGKVLFHRHCGKASFAAFYVVETLTVRNRATAETSIAWETTRGTALAPLPIFFQFTIAKVLRRRGTFTAQARCAGNVVHKTGSHVQETF